MGSDLQWSSVMININQHLGSFSLNLLYSISWVDLIGLTPYIVKISECRTHNPRQNRQLEGSKCLLNTDRTEMQSCGSAAAAGGGGAPPITGNAGLGRSTGK